MYDLMLHASWCSNFCLNIKNNTTAANWISPLAVKWNYIKFNITQNSVHCIKILHFLVQLIYSWDGVYFYPKSQWKIFNLLTRIIKNERSFLCFPEQQISFINYLTRGSDNFPQFFSFIRWYFLFFYAG